MQRSPAPENVSQLNSFIGLVNYYSKFLPDLSTMLAPLYALLQKDTERKWGTEQQKAFEEVKTLLTSDRILVYYDADKELVLVCDESPCDESPNQRCMSFRIGIQTAVRGQLRLRHAR